MHPPLLTRVLIRALFALMVAATVAAFFVAQRIKRGQPVVEKVRFTRHASPNGDGVRDTARIAFRLKSTDRADVSILDRAGDEVHELAVDRRLCGPCTHRFRWNGRDADGRVAADGAYFLRVTLREQGRAVTSPKKLFLDTTPPRPVVRSVTPTTISPDGDGRGDSALIRFEGPAKGAPELIVYRTGNERAVEVARFRARPGADTARWRGRVGGRPAPAGNYLVAVRARDVAGNLGESTGPLRGIAERGDRRIRRSETRSEGHPGLVVRYIAAIGPRGPVRPRRRARFEVRSDRRRYRWAIRRFGAARPLRRGRSGARVLSLRAPARAGVYLLELRAGSHRYRTPFAVRARRRQRVLLVLPGISWQARNLLDSDEDGWGDTLAHDGAVLLRRPFAAGGLPHGFDTDLAPLLELLDRERLAYDLTTDLALARERGPSPAGYAGVLFAGEERWLPTAAARSLREYVHGGGRVGLLAPDSLHRDIRITARRLLNPSRRAREDAFGERTGVGPVEPGALLVLSDRIGFFAQAGSAFGSFDSVETSERLPTAATLLAGAGREVERPAMVVYRLGRGVVARLGADGLVAQTGSQPGVERIMLRLWKLLSR